MRLVGYGAGTAEQGDQAPHRPRDRHAPLRISHKTQPLRESPTIVAEVPRLQRAVAAVGDASRDADRRIEKLAKEIAAGSAKLELWGLMLVGAGSLLLSIPPFFG